jgi:SAM-dependent methyltransferase
MPHSVLDVGARDMVLLRSLGDSVPKRTALDLDFPARLEGVEAVQHDLRQSLPFKSNSFDFVACLDVIEHIDDKERLFDDLLRVARIGLVVSLPNINCIDYLRSAVRGRPLSKHYRFMVDDFADRHRWAPSYGEIFAWADAKQRPGIAVRCLARTCANTRLLPLSLLPDYMSVFNVILLFEKA